MRSEAGESLLVGQCGEVHPRLPSAWIMISDVVWYTQSRILKSMWNHGNHYGYFHTAAPPALHINVSLHLLVSASARVSTGGQRSSSGFSPVPLPNILSAHLPTPTSLSLFVPLAFPKPHSRRRVDTQRVWQWSLRHGNDKQGKISSVAGSSEGGRQTQRERESWQEVKNASTLTKSSDN